MAVEGPVAKSLVALACLGLIAATVLTENHALERRKHFPAEQDALYLPRPSALKAMSLGHHELTADLVLMRAIIYFGAQLTGPRNYKWLDNYLDTIVALDPNWRTPYRWAGVATMYDGRQITNEGVLESSHFLEMGVKQFPDDWELAFMIGCNYLFEMRSDDPVEKAKWKRIGGEYVRHAALVGGAPSWMPLLAATILTQEGEEEAAIRHLEEVYLSSQDQRTREDVKNRLLALHDKFDFARTERARDDFDRALKATLPYAPPDLFVIVGSRPTVRIDLEALVPK